MQLHRRRRGERERVFQRAARGGAAARAGQHGRGSPAGAATDGRRGDAEDGVVGQGERGASTIVCPICREQAETLLL